MIKIQKNDFSIEDEINKLKSFHPDIGAISHFIGYVRNNNNNKDVNYIDVDVYISMAKKTLNRILEQANKKWSLKDCLVIHRFGKLYINEKIVLVTTFALHRKDSFEACNFIMDYLKKDAPFWKKEFYNENFKWLENTKVKN